MSAFYPAAMAGDVRAATFVLKVINRRCTIMGFDPIDDVTDTARTIVIGGTGEVYTAGLQALVAAQEDGGTPS